MFVPINGKRMYLWRAVDSEGEVLDTHATVYNTFNVQRHLIFRKTLRQFRSEAMSVWQTVTAAA